MEGPSWSQWTASISPATLKEASDAVKSVTSEGKTKWRVSYAKFTPVVMVASHHSFNRKRCHTVPVLIKAPLSNERATYARILIFAL